MFFATKKQVKNRGIPPDAFLEELVAWGKQAPDAIFAPNPAHDVYASVAGVLGPWTGPGHRRAAMLEVMGVLAGFESSWHWTAGVDTASGQVKNPDVKRHEIDEWLSRTAVAEFQAQLQGR
jgi:hypothetical protein